MSQSSDKDELPTDPVILLQILKKTKEAGGGVPDGLVFGAISGAWDKRSDVKDAILELATPQQLRRLKDSLERMAETVKGLLGKSDKTS